MLNLRRLAKSKSLVTVKKNIGAHISNNRGAFHGGYTISGRGGSQNWKTENPDMLGGKDSSNSILFTIEYILKVVKNRIPFHADCRSQYLDLVGFIVTYEDYVQTPHLDINSHKLFSFIIHVPLCITGAWIYLWERDGSVNVKREMIHIPFGSMLVLRSDVWHGGIVGGKGNLRFHAAIMVKDDMLDHDNLVYDCSPATAKKHFDGLKVEYDKAKTLFHPETIRTLTLLPEYLKTHCKHLPPII